MTFVTLWDFSWLARSTASVQVNLHNLQEWDFMVWDFACDLRSFLLFPTKSHAWHGYSIWGVSCSCATLLFWVSLSHPSALTTGLSSSTFSVSTTFWFRDEISWDDELCTVSKCLSRWLLVKNAYPHLSHWCIRFEVSWHLALWFRSSLTVLKLILHS